jgi:hypothetical protein
MVNEKEIEMPIVTTAKCDRCGAAAEVEHDYTELHELGWANVRLHGWTDVRGNQMHPREPSQWVLCPECRAALTRFFTELR